MNRIRKGLWEVRALTQRPEGVREEMGGNRGLGLQVGASTDAKAQGEGALRALGTARWVDGGV